LSVQTFQIPTVSIMTGSPMATALRSVQGRMAAAPAARMAAASRAPALPRRTRQRHSAARGRNAADTARARAERPMRSPPTAARPIVRRLERSSVEARVNATNPARSSGVCRFSVRVRLGNSTAGQYTA
jgi:hypothetical protein